MLVPRLASCRLPALAALSPLLVCGHAFAQTQDPPKPQDPPYHYEPVHSRYLRLDPFDRYGRRRAWNPLTLSDGTGDYPIIGSAGLFDVYNTNKWKGDLPLVGENIFFAGELISTNLFEARDKAGADSETEIRSTEFLTAELFHGDTVFRPPTWRVRANVALDFRDVENNNLSGFDNDAAVQELFAEALLWDMDPYLDFGSIRVGRQAFASDFRNFIFVDNNDGVQLFGSLNESKIDYQIAFFDLVAKDPVSNLNRGFEDREQTFFAANVFFEDLLATGYKIEFTVQWAHDTSGNFVDSAANQINPTVDAYYVGFNGDGRIGGLEVAHALYWMTGKDDFNIIGDQFLVPENVGEQDINAYMAAVEIAVPDNWRRYVFSGLYASGDDDPFDGKGKGFDSVFDNPNFAGGAFGYFHRQAINAGNIGGAGVNLVNTNSFYPNLRTKANNAPNSVNPGLIILHAGCEADLSNYWAVNFNASYLHFADTGVLEALSPTGDSISSSLGVDLSLAAEWRPFGVDNVIVTPGIQGLFSTGGLEDLTGDTALGALFLNAVIIL